MPPSPTFGRILGGYGRPKNIIASFTIFGDQPFVLGDLVQYEEHLGKVETIGFRSTKIRRFDGHLVTIPNARLVSGHIENVGARPHIRRRFHLDLPYDTPPEKVSEARELLHEILDDKDCWPEDFAPKVEFIEFGAYSLRLLVEYRQQPPDYWGAFRRDTEINLEILGRFRDAGIEFAFPSQTVLPDTPVPRTAEDDED